MKSSFISSFRRVPAAFVSSILLFIVTESILVRSEAFWRFCRHYSKPADDDGIRLEYTLRTISNKEEQRTVFLIGSSQVREDFDLEYLNRELGKENTTVYNLGVYGATPIEIFMLKDDLLEKRPDIIIYVAFAGTFYDDYNDNDFRRMKYYFDPAILPYFSKYFGTRMLLSQRGALIDSLLGGFSPLYKYRDSIGRSILAAVQHHTRIKNWTEPRPYIYEENKPERYFLDEIKKANGKRFVPRPYTEMSRELFVLFADDVVSNGVKLIYIDGPTHPLCKKLYGREIDTAYNSFISDQADKIGFVYLAESDLPRFTEEEFIDFTHLNEKGRVKFSQFLKEQLSGMSTRLDWSSLSSVGMADADDRSTSQVSETEGSNVDGGG